MDNKKIEYQVFMDLEEGDRISFRFKNDHTFVIGYVVTKAKIEQDPIDGQYYTVGAEIGNHFLKIDSREVEEFWKSSCHGWQKDNNILGKDYPSEDFGLDSNVGDKEFIRQILEKWNTYNLSQQYYLSDLITASISGETFKMIIDSALDEQKIKEKVIADLSEKYAVACGIIGAGALIGVVAGLLLEDKNLEEGQR